MNPDLKLRIEQMLQANAIVLFMKGNRRQPRCGFSAAALNALGSVTDAFHDVDVLADAELREGIKVYGNWPTIPQLYVKGELIGGADIIQQMVNSGELHALLGVAAPDRTPPNLSISDPAAAAIREALDDAGDDALHLMIDAQFRAQFQLKPASGHEIAALANGITVLFDPASARRADGLAIDWAETVQGGGLVLKNPNLPAGVKAIDVRELAQQLASKSVQVVDVRPAAQRALAPFAAASHVLEGNLSALLDLPKDTPLAFLCHHGISSRAAADHFRAQGFTRLYNIEGGIDAWSQHVDAAVPRY